MGENSIETWAAPRILSNRPGLPRFRTQHILRGVDCFYKHHFLYGDCVNPARHDGCVGILRSGYSGNALGTGWRVWDGIVLAVTGVFTISWIGVDTSDPQRCYAA